MFKKPCLRPLGGPDFSIHNMGSMLLGLGIFLFLVVQTLSHPLAMADQAAVMPTSEENQPESAVSAIEFLEETLHRKGESREAREERGASPVRFPPATLRARLELGFGSIDGDMSARPPEVRATRLVIPTLELDAPVVEVSITNKIWDVSGLTYEIAHLGGTANPGEKNNMVLAGHVTLKRGAGPFLHVESLEPGDMAIVYAEEQAYTYRVVSKMYIGPTDVSVAYPTSDPILTLLTCTNWDAETRTYTGRVVVIAELVEDRTP